MEIFNARKTYSSRKGRNCAVLVNCRSPVPRGAKLKRHTERKCFSTPVFLDNGGKQRRRKVDILPNIGEEATEMPRSMDSDVPNVGTLSCLKPDLVTESSVQSRTNEDIRNERPHEKEYTCGNSGSKTSQDISEIASEMTVPSGASSFLLTCLDSDVISYCTSSSSTSDTCSSPEVFRESESLDRSVQLNLKADGKKNSTLLDTSMAVDIDMLPSPSNLSGIVDRSLQLKLKVDSKKNSTLLDTSMAVDINMVLPPSNLSDIVDWTVKDSNEQDSKSEPTFKEPRSPVIAKTASTIISGKKLYKVVSVKEKTPQQECGVDLSVLKIPEKKKVADKSSSAAVLKCRKKVNFDPVETEPPSRSMARPIGMNCTDGFLNCAPDHSDTAGRTIVATLASQNTPELANRKNATEQELIKDQFVNIQQHENKDGLCQLNQVAEKCFSTTVAKCLKVNFNNQKEAESPSRHMAKHTKMNCTDGCLEATLASQNTAELAKRKNTTEEGPLSSKVSNEQIGDRFVSIQQYENKDSLCRLDQVTEKFSTSSAVVKRHKKVNFSDPLETEPQPQNRLTRINCTDRFLNSALKVSAVTQLDAAEKHAELLTTRVRMRPLGRGKRREQCKYNVRCSTKIETRSNVKLNVHKNWGIKTSTPFQTPEHATPDVSPVCASSMNEELVANTTGVYVNSEEIVPASLSLEENKDCAPFEQVKKICSIITTPVCCEPSMVSCSAVDKGVHQSITKVQHDIITADSTNWIHTLRGCAYYVSSNDK